MKNEPLTLTVSQLAGIILKTAAVGTVVIAVGTWGWNVSNNLSTDDERALLEEHIMDAHDNDITAVGDAFATALAPIQKSLESSETEDLVSRLTRLMDIRCLHELNATAWTLQDILDTVNDRYDELMGSSFPDGTCLQGKRMAP